jgi:hypothetical protein
MEVVVGEHQGFRFRSSSKRATFPGSFFAEVVEQRDIVGRAGVKGSLDGFGVGVVVLHVVGEDHELGQVDEAPELRVAASGADAGALRQDAVPVVGLFDLDENQGRPLISKVMSGRNSSSPFT